ncbi:MAG: protein-methionine-sulfoxide reductase catalytic subunit MsrP [Myxococcota bacterium]
MPRRDDLPPEPKSGAITPPERYANRRAFLKQAGLFAGVGAAWGGGLIALSGRGAADPPPAPAPIPSGDAGDAWQRIARPGDYDTDEARTSFEDVTTYNNYYELGTTKSAPAENAHTLKPRPWTVKIGGEVAKSRTVDVDELIRRFGLEERVYRMRCVEAWSMVIPWVGFPLRALVAWAQPTSRAKFVMMKTLLDPEQLPGQGRPVLDWPYTEGLRIDEATNPLTLMAVGLYGAPLLGQNGAPLRLVVPWKYGFKGVKSITQIWFTESMPRTTWRVANAREYGFYANVNPEVSHPRWSQATERRIGSVGRIPTEKFNGYGEWVADMYRGMDLTRYY